MIAENIIYVNFEQKKPIVSSEERARYFAERWDRFKQNNNSRRLQNMRRNHLESDVSYTDTFIMTVNNLIGLHSARRHRGNELEIRRYHQRLEQHTAQLSPEAQHLAVLVSENCIELACAAAPFVAPIEARDNVIEFRPRS
jgi:hypothetical protein